MLQMRINGIRWVSMVSVSNIMSEMASTTKIGTAHTLQSFQIQRLIRRILVSGTYWAYIGSREETLLGGATERSGHMSAMNQ